MVINLIKAKDVPGIGKHLGNFLDITKESGKNEEGNEFNDLVVRSELDTTDKAGKRFQLEKRYNLDGRGLATFREDFRSWSGRKLSDPELAVFDPDRLMKGQRVTVVVKHRKDGKEFIPVIDTFLPAATPTQGN